MILIEHHTVQLYWYSIKTSEEKNLNGLLYRADKMSRACFCCQVEPICNWKDEKKNLKLKY